MAVRRLSPPSCEVCRISCAEMAQSGEEKPYCESQITVGNPQRMVEARRRELRNYIDAKAKEPFQNWLDDLDSVARNVIQARLIRVSQGNFGDCHSVGHGVSEFRINSGPGYRVYFGQDGDAVILLTGGDKRTQKKDVAIAQKYWRDYHA